MRYGSVTVIVPCMTLVEQVKKDVLKVLRRRKRGVCRAEILEHTGHKEMPVYRALVALRNEKRVVMEGIARGATWRAA